MNVTDIRDARAAKAKVKMVAATKMDLMMAGHIFAVAAQMNRVAQYLNETGRHHDAGMLLALAETASEAADRLRDGTGS